VTPPTRRPRARFAWKLFAGYVVLIALTAIAIGLTAMGKAASDMRDLIRDDLAARAELFAEILDRQLPPDYEGGLQARTRRIGDRLATRFTLVLDDGTVVADSQRDPLRLDDHGRRPEIVEARRRGSGSSVRRSASVGEELMYVALRLENGGGFVRASLPLTAIEEHLADQEAIVFTSVIAGAVVALLLGFLVAQRLVRPISRIAAAAEALAAGDYGHRVGRYSNDELGVLARQVDEMADQLQARLATITAERNRLETVLAAMVEGVIAVDRERRVLHLNTAAASILGAGDDAAGAPFWVICRLPDLPGAVEDALETGKMNRLELTLHEPGERHLDVEVRPTGQEGDAPPEGAVVVIHDQTQLRYLEQVRRDFFANVSHEMKTPLTAIIGSLETILDDDDMEYAVRRRFLESALGQSTRLDKLINDLLTLSRLEWSALEKDFGSVDLAGTVRNCVRSLEPQAAAKEIHLVTDLPSGPVRIHGDGESLRQAVDNLIANAIAYTPEGGGVEVRLRTDDGRAMIEVEDTGIGIAPDDRERVFERFFRVDKARSRRVGGTGLGLAIVKHAALIHGGSVEVESHLGQGSRFRIEIPLPGA